MSDEQLLTQRFRALAGPADGDWHDVQRRARRRAGRLLVAAAAVAVGLAAAGLAIGGEVIGLFAEHGKRVPLSSFTPRDRELLVRSLCRHPALSPAPGRAPEVFCRDGAPTVEEIANDGAEIHWRVRYPWGLTCLASGRVGGYHNPSFGDSKIGSLGCNAGAPDHKLVPTPKRPITVDASLGASTGHPQMRLLRLSGLAGRGIVRVGLLAKAAAPLMTEVRGNAYSFRTIPDRAWKAVAAYDEEGHEVYREPLEGVGQSFAPPVSRAAAPAQVWVPKLPARPNGKPLQRAATPDVTADVYRNGAVLMRFSSTENEAYRHLARSARMSSGVVGIGCRQVGFGAGRWKDLGGGTNARVGLEMGMQLTGAPGGNPSPPFDVCEISGTYGRYWNDEEGPRELVEVAFTPIGRRYLEERATARDLAYFVRTRKLRRIRLAIHRGETGPSATELARIFGERVVPLGSRKGTPAPGKVGVWTDGKLIVASEPTPGGRRLYVTVRDVFIGANNIRDLAFPF